MANLVEQVISTVFGKSGSEFINTMSRGITQNVDRFYDFVYVKVFGLPFVVLARGRRARPR